MLMNLVNLRYSDPPVFLDVASVISQYQLDSAVNLALTRVSPVTSAMTNAKSTGGAVVYTDSPTVTYNLVSGDKFAQPHDAYPTGVHHVAY